MPTNTSLRSALDQAAAVLESARQDGTLERSHARFVDAAVSAFRARGRVFVCGNGGSMSDAMHFAEELCGRFRDARPALPALAFSDPATLTCIANDFGFDQVFARQIEAHAGSGDVVVLLSTSGESPNLVAAARTARERGAFSVALLGRGGGKVATEVDVAMVVPDAQDSERIQEVHLLLLHAAVDAIEAELFPTAP